MFLVFGIKPGFMKMVANFLCYFQISFDIQCQVVLTNQVNCLWCAHNCSGHVCACSSFGFYFKFFFKLKVQIILSNLDFAWKIRAHSSVCTVHL